MSLTRREIGALAAFAIIGSITAVWWALALWPLPTDAADWLVRTRAVCFGSIHNGLPTTAGWMVLIGQPVYMLAALWLISGHTLMSGLRRLATVPMGRTTLLVVGAGTVTALALAGIRVARAAGAADFATPSPAALVSEMSRRHDPAPPLALVDQDGAAVTLARFHGRPVFVTFAYAHCETVCPLIVQDVLKAQAEAAALNPAVVIVTLDPWRDSPARLAAIAAQWRLPRDAHVLSGDVAAVERTLDAWQVGRTRSAQTGEVTHMGVVYVLDRQGQVAFALTGVTDPATLVAATRRLE
ncbi:MAG TPA: SCO family protein [Gemmatimonadales bacterium]